MGFTWGGFCGLFGVFVPNLFLPALHAQPGSSENPQMDDFMRRMPEHEHVAHKLSSVKSSRGQCLAAGQATFRPACAEDVCVRIPLPSTHAVADCDGFVRRWTSGVSPTWAGSHQVCQSSGASGFLCIRLCVICAALGLYKRVFSDEEILW